MRAGDLVRWTHPSAPDVGLVLAIRVDAAMILWATESRGMPLSYHPLHSKHLELVTAKE